MNGLMGVYMVLLWIRDRRHGCAPFVYTPPPLDEASERYLPDAIIPAAVPENEAVKMVGLSGEKDILFTGKRRARGSPNRRWHRRLRRLRPQDRCLLRRRLRRPHRCSRPALGPRCPRRRCR